MPLSRTVLSSGRSIELAELRMSSTCDGMLEGYPSKPDSRLGTDGELVVPRGNGTLPLAAVDPALDGVQPALVGRVDTWRSATAGTKLLAMTCLAGLVRDGAADVATTQVVAVLAGRVRLVGVPRIGADARQPP